MTENNGHIFGNRVLNTYYELTARCDNRGSGIYDWFWFGIVDTSYKNKSSIGKG